MTNYAINNADLMAQDAIRRRALLAQQNGYAQQTNSADEESIMTQNQSAKSDNVVGKDDGKIGFWKGLKSFGKGLLNFGKGLIGFDRNGNFSVGRLLKNVAIGAGVAAACVLTAGTAVPAIIAGLGVGTAGWGLAKSQYQFWTAKTDAQAIAAMEDTGSNVAGLGLSLVGAKATMRQVPGVDAAKYKGFMGTLRAGWDSTTIGFSKGFSGLKTGYKAYRDGGFQTLRTVAKENWTGFKNTVVTKYKNATKVPTLEKQQTNRVKQYEDKVTNLKEQLQNATDKVEKRTLQKQINRLEAQKSNVEQAFNEINSEKSFATAQAKLSEVKLEIAKLKNQSKMSEGTITGTKANVKLAQLEQQANIYESVISQKATQARNIRAEIETLQKIKVKDRTPEQVAKLTKLREQQKDLGFKLPSRKEYETLAKKSTEAAKDLVKKQEAYDKVQKECAAAEKAAKKLFKADASSDEAMVAQLKYYKAKDAVNNAYQELAQAKIQNASNQAFKSAASGADYTGAFIPKAGQFFQTFNNLYGKADVPFVSGKHVPFTQLSVPRNIGKAHTIVATNEWVNPSVGGPSLDEMLMQELQNEQVAQYKQATQAQQAPTEADYAKAYDQAFNEYQALLQAQQAQAGVQQTAHQAPTAADYQALDYLMKANGIVA